MIDLVQQESRDEGNWLQMLTGEVGMDQSSQFYDARWMKS